MRAALLLATLAACGRFNFGEVVRADGDVDARLDLGPWGTPIPLASINLISSDDDPSVTEDGLELYFNSSSPRQGSIAQGDIFVATRATTSAPFGNVTVVPGISTLEDETRPLISASGLTLVFGAVRGGNQRDVYVATRPDRTSPWGTAVLAASMGASNEATAFIVQGGLAMFVDSDISGNAELYLQTRPDVGAPWSTPTLLSISDPTAADGEQWVSEDGLMILFGSDRAGGQGMAIWEATRASTSDEFGTPRLVSELDTPGLDTDPFLTADLRTIYFTSDRDGGADLFVATR